MSDHVLITGGAGFIGSHVADELTQHGVRVRVLDTLTPQVHGPGRQRPAYLHPEVELVLGDVRERETVTRALRGITAVIHLAARVGVGQSMVRIEEYTAENGVGTAVLLEALAANPVRRLVVASSMSIYGEGLYRSATGEIVSGARRALEDVQKRRWEVRSASGEDLVPMPTPESKPPVLESVYALSKYHQERLCLIAGRAYGIPTLALRFFNVYGPRQALSNPYTGVLAIFAARLLNERPATIFEDGLQRRDFVSVHDVARACRLALTSDARDQALNVGSGRACTVLEIEGYLRRALDRERLAPQITGRARVGDVRHCFSDIQAARDALGYEPSVSIEEGIAELAVWLRGQKAMDHTAEARAELDARGLTL